MSFHMLLSKLLPDSLILDATFLQFFLDPCDEYHVVPSKTYVCPFQ